MKVAFCSLLIALVLLTACAYVPPATPATSSSMPQATAAPSPASTKNVPVASLTSAVTPAPPTVTPSPAPVLQPSPSVTPQEMALPTSPAPPVTVTGATATSAIAAIAPTSPPPPTLTPVASRTAGPTPDVDIIVDNRDPGFATSGSWFDGDGGYSYNGDCKWAPRGLGSGAYFKPQLPVRGSYEVFGWWCGDANHDQTRQAPIYIYPTLGRIVPYQVTVDLQQNAGQWVSLGTYFMETVGWVSLGSNLYGNVVADAFRFVYRSPDDITTPPTPAPTPQIWTNHPPSPLEQLTSGDLSSRLGLVQWLYPYTPMVWSREVDYDDCAAFPRNGCGGVRHAWDVVVQYKDQNVPYRVSADYKHVALQEPEKLPGWQTLYLMVTSGHWFMRFDRYPDDTWWASSTTYEPGSPAGTSPLDEATEAEIRRLAEKYNTVRARLSNGFDVTFYGQGTLVEFEPADADALGQLLTSMTAIGIHAP